MDVLIAARQVSKSFGGVRALHQADFELRAGEVHEREMALVNGTHRGNESDGVVREASRIDPLAQQAKIPDFFH